MGGGQNPKSAVHSLRSVVLPNPAGVEMGVNLRRRPQQRGLTIREMILKVCRLKDFILVE